VTSFTHNRLLRHKAGPNVRPGSLRIEGELAESWQQTSDTTYVFKLRRGARFHAKPPVNGRELIADDVRYTFEHILTEKGSANVSMFRAIGKIEAVDRYTVRFTLKEPFAWFLDMIANPMAGAIIARECVEKFGDLKKPEAVVGTGPWMLDAYRPNVSLTLVRNPTYFVAGLPYIDRGGMFVDEDNASRLAAFLGGKYDLGWEFPRALNRSDWVQLAGPLKKRPPALQMVEVPSNAMNLLHTPPALAQRPGAPAPPLRAGGGPCDHPAGGRRGRDARPAPRRSLRLGAAHRGARRGRSVLSLRSRRGQAPSGCRGPSERVSRERV